MPKAAKKKPKDERDFELWAVQLAARRGLFRVLRLAVENSQSDEMSAALRLRAILGRAKRGNRHARHLWLRACRLAAGRRVSSEAEARDNAFLDVLTAKSRVAALGELVEEWGLSKRYKKLNREIAKAYDPVKLRARRAPTLPLDRAARLSDADLYKIFSAVCRVIKLRESGAVGDELDLDGRAIQKRIGKVVRPRSQLRERSKKRNARSPKGLRDVRSRA